MWSICGACKNTAQNSSEGDHKLSWNASEQIYMCVLITQQRSKSSCTYCYNMMCIYNVYDMYLLSKCAQQSEIWSGDCMYKYSHGAFVNWQQYMWVICGFEVKDISRFSWTKIARSDHGNIRLHCESVRQIFISL